MPSAKPWQNAARARNRRASDRRDVVLSALFTSSDPSHRSHRGIRLTCMGRGRTCVQALPGARVTRVVVADQADCPGCELPVCSEPFITVRRSLRTRFAPGQRSIFASIAVRHFQSPQEVTVKMWRAAPRRYRRSPRRYPTRQATMIRPAANFATTPSSRRIRPPRIRKQPPPVSEPGSGDPNSIFPGCNGPHAPSGRRRQPHCTTPAETQLRHHGISSPSSPINTSLAAHGRTRRPCSETMPEPGGLTIMR